MHTGVVALRGNPLRCISWLGEFSVRWASAGQHSGYGAEMKHEHVSATLRVEVEVGDSCV